MIDLTFRLDPDETTRFEGHVYPPSEDRKEPFCTLWIDYGRTKRATLYFNSLEEIANLTAALHKLATDFGKIVDPEKPAEVAEKPTCSVCKIFLNTEAEVAQGLCPDCAVVAEEIQF